MGNNEKINGSIQRTELFPNSMPKSGLHKGQLAARCAYCLKVSGVIAVGSLVTLYALVHKLAKETFIEEQQKPLDNKKFFSAIFIVTPPFFYMADRLGRWMKERELKHASNNKRSSVDFSCGLSHVDRQAIINGLQARGIGIPRTDEMLIVLYETLTNKYPSVT